MTSIKKIIKLWSLGYKEKSMIVLTISLCVFGLTFLLGFGSNAVNPVGIFMIYCGIHQMIQPITNYMGTGFFKNSPLYKWYQTKGLALSMTLNMLAASIIALIVFGVRWNLTPEIRPMISEAIIMGIGILFASSIMFPIMSKIWWLGLVFCASVGGYCGFLGFFSGKNTMAISEGGSFVEGFSQGFSFGLGSQDSPLGFVSDLPFWSLILITLVSIMFTYVVTLLVCHLVYKLPTRDKSLSVAVREMQ